MDVSAVPPPGGGAAATLLSPSPWVTGGHTRRSGVFLSVGVDVLVMREFTMMDEALVFTTLGDLEAAKSHGPP